MSLVLVNRRQLPLVLAISAACALAVLLLNTFWIASPAERAVRAGDLPRLGRLLDRRPELVNRPNAKNGRTPLHWAVIGDHPEIARRLLDRGADVHAADRFGATPLHTAAAFNRPELARLLLDRGANPAALAIRYGVMRFAPLHLAAEAGGVELIRLLAERGADLNLRTAGRNRVTALHIAAGKGQELTVEMLLQAGVEVNPRDVEGQTPLAWARKAGQEEIVRMLKIYGGAD